MHIYSFIDDNGERYNASTTLTINGTDVLAISSPKVLITMHTHMHVRTHTHTHAHIHTHMHACTHTHTHMHARTHIQTHARACTHTHTHIYIYTYIHTLHMHTILYRCSTMGVNITLVLIYKEYY